MTDVGIWDVLIGSLFESGEILVGQDLSEWLHYVQFDYDEVDRERIDSEAGGA